VLSRPKALFDPPVQNRRCARQRNSLQKMGDARFQWHQPAHYGIKVHHYLHSKSSFCHRGRFPITTSPLSLLISRLGLPLSLGGVARPATGLGRRVSTKGGRRAKPVPVVASGIPVKKLCTIRWSDSQNWYTLTLRQVLSRASNILVWGTYHLASLVFQRTSRRAGGRGCGSEGNV
jgi:hypothetical protein